LRLGPAAPRTRGAARAIGHRAAPETGVDHAAADGDKDQEEGAEQLREQAPSLEVVVPEIELTGN